jgi:hypothetical protein
MNIIGVFKVFLYLNMKYYLPRPIFGYLFLSMIGAGVFGGVVLVGYSMADIDVPDEKRMYILLIGFCLSVLFFVGRAYLKRNRRNYVDLGPGYIEWRIYNRKQTKIERINTSDIRLFEIAYTEGQNQPWFYNVYSPTSELIGGWGLELFAIPYQSILEWCKENAITPLSSIVKYTEIEDVKVNSRQVKIRCYVNPLLFWRRSKKIPFSEIGSIDFVSTHPIAKTEDHYVVTTRERKSYSFSPRIVDEKALLKVATNNGIQVNKEKKY